MRQSAESVKASHDRGPVSPGAPPLAQSGPRRENKRITLERTTMPQTRNPILDDMARLMTDAAGLAQGVKREAETVMRTQLERLLSTMDVVTREEFEAVRDMAILARDENERLQARIAALESQRGGDLQNDAGVDPSM
jgi:BMFP domain-containing protein YqiC